MFKPGDKVKRITYSFGPAKQGEVYTVAENDSNHGLKLVGSEDFTYIEASFELVRSNLILNVGDKVKIKGTNEIIEVIDTNGSREVTVKIGVVTMHINPDNLELVEAAPRFEDRDFWVGVYANGDISFVHSTKDLAEFHCPKGTDIQKITLKVPVK